MAAGQAAGGSLAKFLAWIEGLTNEEWVPHMATLSIAGQWLQLFERNSRIRDAHALRQLMRERDREVEARMVSDA